MNIICFVPARGGSKSIPKKNIKLLNGDPLVSYSIKVALDCGLRTVVSTDDKEIEKVSRRCGAEVMIRPSRLAQDKTSMLEVLQSEVPKITPTPDYVLLLQPTSPLRSNMHIKLAIQLLTKNADRYDSIISAERVPEKYNPYAMIVEATGKKMLFRKLVGWKRKLNSLFTGKKYVGPSLSGYPVSQRVTRRQDLPQAWIPTGEIYFFKSDNLKSGSIYGNNVMLLEAEPILNINTEADFLEAENYLKSKQNV